MKQAETPFSKWAAECKDITLNYFSICESALLSNQNKMGQKLYFLLLQLATSCQCATESSILLVHNYYYLWEAEILIRAVIEGTIKYVYLCIGDEGERTNKATEYLDDLPIIYQIKQHNKATEWLTQVENPEEPRWEPIREIRDLILDPDKLARFELKYPTKQDKKRLEQKWSMNNILQSIHSCKEDIYLDIYNGFCGATFGYDIASHIAHQDAYCIGLMWDRVNREPPREKAVERAHATRELHDLIILAQNRAVITEHMLKMNMKPIVELYKSHENLFLELEKAQSDWFNIEYMNSGK